MKVNTFIQYISEIQKHYHYLTSENIVRMLLLYHGVNYNNEDSYPDAFRHFELIFTVPSFTTFPVLTFLNPESPFTVHDSTPFEKVLLYNNEYIGAIPDFEERSFDFRKSEPFYFYAEEVNGDLVLKLNPIQMCEFFINHQAKPCSFCFRTDTVQRFRNISSNDLVSLIFDQEEKKDKQHMLRSIDEISIVTGSYSNNEEYLQEMVTLVDGVKSKLRPNLRVVVGSHEGKGKRMYEALKNAGVTVFAFPIESLDDNIRIHRMANRKGTVKIRDLKKYIDEGIETFGEDGVILRLVAGIGDTLDDKFRETVKTIAKKYKQSPYWNINIYMPFTHYHWHLFKKKRPYDLDYIFNYSNIINEFVPLERQMRFKVSP